MSDDFEEIAGVLVSPRGMPRLARPGSKRDEGRPATAMPSFGRVGYVAASDRELAVFKTTSIGMTPGPKGAPLTRIPLSDLASAELDERRVVSFLKLRFTDGSDWILQVGRLNRNDGRALVAALQRV